MINIIYEIYRHNMLTQYYVESKINYHLLTIYTRICMAININNAPTLSCDDIMVSFRFVLKCNLFEKS